MRVTLIGTEHSNEDEAIDVTIEKVRVNEDAWTFTVQNITFTISDLSTVMSFLTEYIDG